MADQTPVVWFLPTISLAPFLLNTPLAVTWFLKSAKHTPVPAHVVGSAWNAPPLQLLEVHPSICEDI